MAKRNGSAAVRSDSPAITRESVERALGSLIPDELRFEIDSLADEWDVATAKVVEALGDLFERTMRAEEAIGLKPVDGDVELPGIDQSALNTWLSEHMGLHRIYQSWGTIRDAADFDTPRPAKRQMPPQLRDELVSEALTARKAETDETRP